MSVLSAGGSMTWRQSGSPKVLAYLYKPARAKQVLLCCLRFPNSLSPCLTSPFKPYVSKSAQQTPPHL